ncbi:uncharacterized protein EDB91DRAFT_1109479 [Suillus paluster]|uniref:uncharacterized protein n=1 Tax=Suillus paluster TaxID=48578 RepID=UPI001B87B254|nr:uncharacterized protein EDB91DRAFT_1109479 [Suillus paluster]KAG1749752.1 hypothetical protein EDB91DRAFT_1109479 [Suillus paluster]
MAKQKHVQPDYTPPRPRRNNRRHTPALQYYPSSSVLSILATIAASSQTVDGSPLPLPTPPPSFLCPFIEEHDTLHPRDLSPTITTTSTSTSISSYPKSTKYKPVQVADRYVQGVDGRWYKAEAWTLFGSTSTSSDLTVSTTQSTQATGSAQIDSMLPAGWTTTSTSDRTDSIIILSLAILLAVSICVFIIGCIIWRRRRKKRSNREKKLNDLELKARHKANIEDASEDGEREIEARGKLRLWAKASARWKANIRHSARRRRNRRHGFSSGLLSRPQSPISTEAREEPILPSSPVLSRRHSIVPVSEDNDLHPSTIENSPTPTRPPSTSPIPSSSRIVSLPPAYMFPAPQMRENEERSQEPSDTTSSDATSRRGSLLFGRHDFTPAPEDDDISYRPSFVGHVATDDKAHLARMAELASVPPINGDDTHASSLAVHESAPEWHDDLEYPPSSPTTVGPSATSPFEVGTPGFPIPPSKSVMSSGYFDRHSYLEDIATLDPSALPCMPPYEAGSNLVPFEETLHASAPPISEDDQAFEHWEGTAPEVSDIYSDECDTHIPSSASRPSLSSSQASAPHDQVISMDGALPIYRR